MAQSKRREDADVDAENEITDAGEAVTEEELAAPSIRRALVAAVLVIVVALLGLAPMIGSFGSPKAHRLPLAVAGSDAVVTTVAQQLQRGDDPAFEVRAVPEGKTPKEMVETREVYAALVTTDKEWQVQIAGANGITVNNQLISALRPANNIKVSLIDVSPAPKGDNSGWAVFFVVLVVALAAATFGALLGWARSRPLPTIGALAAFSLVLGVVATLVAKVWFDALNDGFAIIVLLQVLLALVIGSVFLVAARLGRAYGVAIAAFVLLGVGTAYSAVLLPIEFLPTSASGLANFLPNGLAGQGTVGASSFQNDAVVPGLVGLVIWAVVALGIYLGTERGALRSGRAASED